MIKKQPELWTIIPASQLDRIADLARQILQALPRKNGLAVKKRVVSRSKKPLKSSRK